MLDIVNNPHLHTDKFDAKFKKSYFFYEKEAFQLGKGLLKKICKFDTELEELYLTFMYADYEFFWRVISKNNILSDSIFMEYWIDHLSMEEALPSLSSITPPETLKFLVSKEIRVV